MAQSTPFSPFVRAVLAGVMLVAGGCAGQTPPPRTAPIKRPLPASVSEQSYSAHLRHFEQLRVGDPQRDELRRSLVAYLHTHTQPILDAGDYDAVVEHMAAFTSLYTPEEIADGVLPTALEPVCAWLIEHGSPRGDEARVLSSLLVLQQLHPDQPDHASYYQRLRKWTVETRTGLGAPFGIDEDLLDVWQEHTRLTPTPDLLSQLARYHMDFRNALLQQFQSPERIIPMAGREYYELVQRKAFDVAGVFLRFGDTASALSHVKAIGPAGNLDGELLQLLEQAQEGGDEGADALFALAHQPPYARADHAVTEALCRLGRMEYPADTRFPRCLATLATFDADLGAVVEYYTEALSLTGDRERVYDELLVRLSQLLENAPMSADVSEERQIGDRLLSTLSEREREFPGSEPPVTAQQINLSLAMAEMNAGHAARAERYLNASLEAGASVEGHSQLGQLLLRLGRVHEAQVQYSAALALVEGDDPAAMNQRANLLERQGDAARLIGDDQGARASYQQSLGLWDDLSHLLSGTDLSLAHVRRGILLSRLGQEKHAVNAFKAAIEQAQGVAETYRGILAHLVIAEPDRALAHRIFRHALNQLQLEPEWKVYLALWLQIIDGMNEGPAEPEAQAVLEDFAGEGSWWATLASFGAGQIDFDALNLHASDVGQQAEALFYDGARRLSAGDLAAARERFQKVLNTRMVNFYEYIMAQELMRRFPGSPPAVQAEVSAQGE